MELYAESLRDLGHHVSAEHGGASPRWHGRRTTPRSPCSSTSPAGRDVSTYAGRDDPFYKRARLACADLAHAEVVHFRDLDRLRLFADNLVPRVLRVDGVLAYDEGLLARIESGELLEHDSAEEVEIRACAVEAVERIARARAELSPQQLDHVLWNRGREPAYKARPATGRAPPPTDRAGPTTAPSARLPPWPSNANRGCRCARAP